MWKVSRKDTPDELLRIRKRVCIHCERARAQGVSIAATSEQQLQEVRVDIKRVELSSRK